MRHEQFIIYDIYFIHYGICWDPDIAAASGCPARGRAGQAGSGRPRPGPDPYKNQGFEAGGWRPGEAWWLEAVAGPRASPLLFIIFIIFIMDFIGFPTIWLPEPREPPLSFSIPITLMVLL